MAAGRLVGRVALVTGASRGVGRGIAIGLAKAGATTYATGRSIADANLPPGVSRLRCDHAVDQAKAATDKLSADTAHELREHGVAVVSLYPGLVRTEAVLAAGVFDLSNSEGPEFLGRVVAALASDPGLMERSGRVVVAAALAREYGVTDVDGRSPRPLSLADV